MRSLHTHELPHVSGAGEVIVLPPGDLGGGSTPTPTERLKNNNGYDNGAEAGPPPGHSGDHNPQLTGWNEGPLGVR